ncbi:hypothetical protein SLE2022_134700 [Rubroshorea leprosula]
MGQSASGNNGYKVKEFDRIVERCYQTHFADVMDCTSADFYRAVCETVEEINKKLGSTQFSVPKITTLKLIFAKHLNALEKVTDEDATDKSAEIATYETLITREKFEEILQEVIVESGFTTDFRVMDILTYIFGVPVTALIIKQYFGLEAIPDYLFITVITTATVFLLAKLHKI